MTLTAQHGSFLVQINLTDWEVKTETEGNVTAGKLLYFWVQLVNRVGKNLLSAAKSISVVAGEKIIITFNDTIVLPGEDVFIFLVSASLTNDVTTAVQVAQFDYREADQISVKSLPATIELTEDAHLEVDNLNVATANDLPSGTDLLNGMVRIIDDEAKAFCYNEEEDVWLEYLFSSPLTNIQSTEDSEGADQLLGAAPLFPPLQKLGSADSVRVRYWLINGFDENSSQVVKSGQSINFILSVNGQTYNSLEGRSLWFNQVFDGLIKFELIGYFRYSNGFLNSLLDGVGVEQTWSPLSVPPSLLSLPEDLPPGWALVLDVWLSFNQIALQNRGIKDDDLIGINFDLPRKIATPSPLVNAFGNNLILGTSDRALVLPDKIFAGKGIVQGFDISIEEQSLVGIVADTDNQLVVVDGATDTVRLIQSSDTIFASEAIRATVSTISGRTNPSEPSDVVTIAAGQVLEITINLPVIGNRGTVRTDYTDPLIAGSSLGFWNNPSIRLEIAFGDVLYEAENLIDSDTAATQVIQVSSLDDYVEVPFIPQQSSDFGIFPALKPAVQATGTTGTLDPGSYRVYVVLEYPAPNTKITKISHDETIINAIRSDASILNTMPASLEELSKPSLWSNDLLATVDEARTLTHQDLQPWRTWKIGAKRIPYHYDPDNNEADDGVSVIRPSAIATGALVPVPSLGVRWESSLITYSPHLFTRIGAGLLLTEDVAGDAMVISLDTSAVIPPEATSEPLYTSDGSVLQTSSGEFFRQ